MVYCCLNLFVNKLEQQILELPLQTLSLEHLKQACIKGSHTIVPCQSQVGKIFA